LSKSSEPDWILALAKLKEKHDCVGCAMHGSLAWDAIHAICKSQAVTCESCKDAYELSVFWHDMVNVLKKGLGPFDAENWNYWMSELVNKGNQKGEQVQTTKGCGRGSIVKERFGENHEIEFCTKEGIKELTKVLHDHNKETDKEKLEFEHELPRMIQTIFMAESEGKEFGFCHGSAITKGEEHSVNLGQCAGRWAFHVHPNGILLPSDKDVLSSVANKQTYELIGTSKGIVAYGPNGPYWKA
jgi:hypothetical protein